MTPQRLAEIRTMLEETQAARAQLRTFAGNGLGEGAPAPMMQAAIDLLADNERLRAVVEELAETWGHLNCRFCHINERWAQEFPDRWGVHSPDCLVTKARVALGDYDAPS